MATIKSYDSANQLRVDANGALRAILYDANGNVISSQIRGTGLNMGNNDVRDGIAIVGPSASGAVVLGTSTNPVRTDPTGTTSQPVTGTVGVSNFPATQAVTGTIGINNFPATQPVSGTIALASGTQVGVTNFPTTQQVAGSVAVTNQPSSMTISNFPATQPVSGTVNANLRLGGADVSAGNALPVALQGDLSVSEADIGVSYALAFEVAPATTLAAGTTYFTLRNNGGRVVYVRRLDIQQGFTGTAAASRSTFDFVRFSGSAPTGGTVMTPVKKNSTTTASVCTANQLGTGVTTTGVTFESFPFHRQSSPNQLTASTTQDVSFGDVTASYLALQPNEGIAIRASAAVVAGCYMTGSIGWHEK